LTNVPSFSAKLAAGSMKTSVCTSSGFRLDSARISGFQKAAVSCSKFSATTSHFSFASAATALRELGPLLTGFIPKLKSPSISPRYMWSKMYAQLQFS
jgi:hypothetical protein